MKRHHHSDQPPPPDRQRLARLRQLFLEGAGGGVYWESEEDLDAYDRTFGARIGWKWDWVLAELDGLGWRPPEGEVFDWGCGSGVAVRAFLRTFGGQSTPQVILWDHSPLARQVAARKVRSEFPDVAVRESAGDASPRCTLLVSHVLTELSPRGLDALVRQARQAEAVLWVEPGAREAARLLSDVREALLPDFSMLAPCPAARMTCQLQSPENARDWCHQFAPPPPFVFTDSFWVHFGREAGLDLRSLPLSFLAMDRRPATPLPEGTRRILGRPRLAKGAVRLLACGTEGIYDLHLLRREHPELFRHAQKGKFPSRFAV